MITQLKMETCVLIPPEFALGYSKDAKFAVLSTRTLKPGMLFHPFQGNIRIDKLAAPRYIDEDDVSSSREASEERFSRSAENYDHRRDFHTGVKK